MERWVQKKRLANKMVKHKVEISSKDGIVKPV